MGNFEDYYEILQVHFLAEPDIIKAAYRKLAQLYAPDVNKSPDATVKMTRINAAYAVLSDPDKRKNYDANWTSRKSNEAKQEGPQLTKPKPVIKPKNILFSNMVPGQSKKTTFIVDNIGGSYNRLYISNPNSWLRVVNKRSLTTVKELPSEVEIEATGLPWGETASEIIYVKLDDEVTQVVVKTQARLPSNPPKPIVKPSRICFADIGPGQTKRISFVITNEGGSYSNLWFTRPNSWLKVIKWHSLSQDDELPLEIEIEATGLQLGESASEIMQVKLDSEYTLVKVELQSISEMRPKALICPNCSQHNDLTKLYCHQCCAILEPINCKYCGKKISKKAVFCRVCGKKQ